MIKPLTSKLKKFCREEIRCQVMKGVEDMKAGRFTIISNEVEAKQIVEKIKQQGREKLAERLK